jgi:hypothetical protein
MRSRFRDAMLVIATAATFGPPASDLAGCSSVAMPLILAIRTEVDAPDLKDESVYSNARWAGPVSLSWLRLECNDASD